MRFIIFVMTFLGINRCWNQAGLNTNANLCLVMSALFLFLVSHIQSGLQEIELIEQGLEKTPYKLG
jgi:hypothetical protein